MMCLVLQANLRCQNPDAPRGPNLEYSVRRAIPPNVLQLPVAMRTVPGLDSLVAREVFHPRLPNILLVALNVDQVPLRANCTP